MVEGFRGNNSGFIRSKTARRSNTVVHSNREFSDEGNLLASGGDLGRFEDDRFLDIERPQLLAEI